MSVAIKWISYFSLFFLLLFWWACSKPVVLKISTAESSLEEETPDFIIPTPVPRDPTLKTLFKIGTELGARVGVCEDGKCKSIALEVQGESKSGTTEEDLLNELTLEYNILTIGKKLADNLTGIAYATLKSEKAIIAIPLLLEHPKEVIQDLSFKVDVSGISPLMQIGYYAGPNGKRKEVRGLTAFTPRSPITKKIGTATAVDGIYYLLLQMSLEEVKEMYDRIRRSRAVYLTITGTAKNYEEQTEIIYSSAGR